ncbi:MAG: TRAP transporter substrate-binding protein DctP [Gammaproteobacteria bacterium]|nr:TRAP transporter substrate-binding protein DctP [Gammaproteobacteria bacterium]
MKRREFVSGLGLAAGLSACGSPDSTGQAGSERSQETFRWNMVTSWPPGLPGTGVGAQKVARRIEAASNGRLRIKVYAGGELVPALEVFDAVRSGTAQMGHDASYYHRGKVAAAQYFTCIPFGLNAQEMNAWMYWGGGLELWQELFAPFGIVPFPVGNTGVQMAGWFNKEIISVDDLAGLKIRMPGLGGEVMQRAGAVQVTVPGSEIFTSLQSGAIDAAEWIGPYNDVSLGLHKAAQYYYYPGWHEPGPVIECLVNKSAWESLPADLQQIVKLACQAGVVDMQAEYDWGNAQALKQLQDDPNVDIRPLPKDVLDTLRAFSREAVNEMSVNDEFAARLQASFDAFQELSSVNQSVGETAYINYRVGLCS